MTRRWRYPYDPTPKQVLAHQTVCDEMLYGGSAGGGKSEMLLASVVTMALLVPGSASIIFRRTFPDLNRSLIPRLMARIPPEVARYHSSEHTYKFHNGSRLELAHLSTELDVLKYQGAEYQLVCFDELTQFTSGQYAYLKSRLRAAGPVRDRMQELGLRPRVLSAANPGGPGHLWVKAHFIDGAPPGRVWTPPATPDDPRPGTRVYVPARLGDNPHLDAGYSDRLSGLGDPTLVRALRDGDWDILAGVRFESWRREIHVIDPGDLPIPHGGVPRVIGVDYGQQAPFSAHWIAKLGDGLMVVYRELHEVGLTAREQAEAIRDAEMPGERGTGRRIPIALDPACWARSAHVSSKVKPVTPDAPPPGSIAHAYRAVLGPEVIKARNNRRDGVQLVDDKLRVRPDGLPRLLVYSSCVNLIRTLPTLPRSNRDLEDVDTSADDHDYDSLRYGLMELEGKRVLSDRQGELEGAAKAIAGMGFQLAGAGF